METLDLSPVTLADMQKHLSSRVSNYNARLLLHTAVQKSGLAATDLQTLKKEHARSICMQLINQGGPAFQVGKDLYQQLQ